MKIEESDLNKAKEIIIKWAINKPFITRVYLFGSRVTGVSGKIGKPVEPDSDLDVAIEHDKVYESEDAFTTWIADSKKWHRELIALLGFSKNKDLDLERYHPVGTPHIDKYIKENSILIYEKNKK